MHYDSLFFVLFLFSFSGITVHTYVAKIKLGLLLFIFFLSWIIWYYQRFTLQMLTLIARVPFPLTIIIMTATLFKHSYRQLRRRYSTTKDLDKASVHFDLSKLSNSFSILQRKIKCVGLIVVRSHSLVLKQEVTALVFNSHTKVTCHLSSTAIWFDRKRGTMPSSTF